MTPRAGRVAGILLAAGAARRFGSQKLVHPIDGVPLVRRAADGLLGSALDEVVVVLGSDAPRVGAALAGLPVRTVVAEDWDHGMSASIRAGIAALAPEIDAALIALGDQPGVGAAIVDPLVACWRSGRADRPIVAPDYRGVVRPPVLFDRALFAALQQLDGDRGARALLDARPEQVARVALDHEEPADVDVPAGANRVATRRAHGMPAENGG